MPWGVVKQGFPHHREFGVFALDRARKASDLVRRGQASCLQSITKDEAKCRRSPCVSWLLVLLCPGFPARLATGADATKRDATDCPFARAARNRAQSARMMLNPGAEAHAPAKCPQTAAGTAVQSAGRRRPLYPSLTRTMGNPPPSQRYRTCRNSEVMRLVTLVNIGMPQNRTETSPDCTAVPPPCRARVRAALCLMGYRRNARPPV